MAILCVWCFMLSRELLKHWLWVLNICKINWLIKMMILNRPLISAIRCWLRIWNSYKRVWCWFFLNYVLILIWYILRVNSTINPVFMSFKLFLHTTEWWAWWVNILSLKRNTHAIFILVLHLLVKSTILIR